MVRLERRRGSIHIRFILTNVSSKEIQRVKGCDDASPFHNVSGGHNFFFSDYAAVLRIPAINSSITQIASSTVDCTGILRPI